MRLLKSSDNTVKKLTPLENARLAVLSNRLGITHDEAGRLLNGIQSEISQTLGVPGVTVASDCEFAGRDLDLVFTINKQNTPNKRK
ncbi:MAG: hypothetical protein EOM80_15920 [Erysipelotrichia bacterium]|nr:hypothetical protein [Candidatus Riflebacteria bacterium]NCB40247.1 hypothetical protein [Erysipelotrichia bacterium]